MPNNIKFDLNILPQSPISGVTVGTQVFSRDGKFIGNALAEDSQITVVQHSSKKDTYKQGNTHHAAAYQLQNGTMSMSGSYGVGGVAKIGAAFSAFVGNEQRHNTKSLSLTQTVFVASGIEYINFGELTTSQLMASLTGGAREELLKVLVAFNAAVEDSSETTLDAWYQQIDAFMKEHGDGMVAGVYWGGYGAVKFEMDANYSDNKWRDSEQYQTSGSMLLGDFKMNLSHEGRSEDAKQQSDYSISSASRGEIVKEQIDSWAKSMWETANALLVADYKDDPAKSKDALNDIKTPPLPVAPKFTAPQGEKLQQDADKLPPSITRVQTEQFAKYFAKRSEGSNGVTLDEKARFEGIKQTITEIRGPILKPTNEAPAPARALLRAGAPQAMMATLPPSDDATAIIRTTGAKADGDKAPVYGRKMSENYEPVGVFVVGWDKLFPWMSRAILNDFLPDKELEDRLKLQTYEQELVTLINIYKLVKKAQLSSLKGTEITGADAVINDLTAALGILSENYTTQGMNKSDDALQDPQVKSILAAWSAAKPLRNAELGLGLVVTEGDTKVTIRRTETTDASHADTGEALPMAWYEDGTINLKFGTSKNRFKGKNYQVFTESYPLMPVPLCVDDMVKWYAFGPQGMVLKSFDKDAITFTKSVNDAIPFEFEFDNPNCALSSQLATDKSDVKAELVSLPAIKGGWGSGGTSIIGPMAMFNPNSASAFYAQLENMMEALEGKNALSLSSDESYWPWGDAWSANDQYKPNALGIHYYGFVEVNGTLPFGISND